MSSFFVLLFWLLISFANLREPLRSFAFMLLTFLTTRKAVNGNIKLFSLPRVSAHRLLLTAYRSRITIHG